MSPGPAEEAGQADQSEVLRAERDALAHRCALAEEQVALLAAELTAVREQLAAAEAAADGALSIFDGEPFDGGRPLGDGSDPRVLSLVLAAAAVVAGLVALMALFSGTLMTPFGLLMVLLTAALAWGSSQAREQTSEVRLEDGVVHVSKGGSTHRFDLGTPWTEVELVGRPGEPGWEARFLRRGLQPVVVDGSMVDDEEFTRQLREHRPEL